MADQKMTETERQDFLAALHVGVLGIERADGPPLLLPVWYSYEPGGDVEVLTSASSLKGRLAAAAGRASLCVQQEEVPYKYVSVEGPITIDELGADRHHAVEPMALHTGQRRVDPAVVLGRRHDHPLLEIGVDARHVHGRIVVGAARAHPGPVGAQDASTSPSPARRQPAPSSAARSRRALATAPGVSPCTQMLCIAVGSTLPLRATMPPASSMRVTCATNVA